MSISINNKETDIYRGLLEFSIGFNPRSIKRLLNSFLLLNTVAKKKGLFAENEEDENKKVKQRTLFACLCLQMAFNPIYEYLLKNLNEINADLLHIFSDFSELKKEISLLKEIKQYEKADNFLLKRISDYMGNFNLAIKMDNPDDFSDDEISNLKMILSFSSITSVSQEGRETSSEPEKWKKKDLGNWENYIEFVKKYKREKEIFKQIYDYISDNFKEQVQISYSPSYISFKNKESRLKQFSFATLNPWFIKHIILGFSLGPKDPAPEKAIRNNYQPVRYRDKIINYSIELEDVLDSFTDEVKKAIKRSFELSKLL